MVLPKLLFMLADCFGSITALFRCLYKHNVDDLYVILLGRSGLAWARFAGSRNISVVVIPEPTSTGSTAEKKGGAENEKQQVTSDEDLLRLHMFGAGRLTSC